jgi:hypothetical protein
MSPITPKTPADSMSGYKVTVIRTLHLVGRYRSRESAEEFGRGLADSGQLAPSDWETAVTVEPLDPDPAADRMRRAAELCQPLMEASDADLRDAMILIGAEKRNRLRLLLRSSPTTREG